MKLKFDIKNKSHADPFIFEDCGRFYLYVTGRDGVEAYESDDIFGEWKYIGIVFSKENCKDYWAPSVIKFKDKYYIYVSFSGENFFQWLHVAEANSPKGPFINPKLLYSRFSIDSHAVETKEGLYLFYAEDNLNEERFGTRIFIDKLIDPYTPANICKEIVSPSFDEEIYRRNRLGDGRNWHTLEGPFWFKDKGYQYLMYSGGCFQNDTYHIGFAYCEDTSDELISLDFTKFTDNGLFSPVLIKDNIEEGTGHHSVIKYKGEYYCIYHARDINPETDFNDRTARICKLIVNKGAIKAEKI
ncbi:MAG: hypothetical protein E7564_11085 [Ruminococcaceae bacterium]|nr:hypothetical protein [Oscillospiraceae bacterium]